jgi:RNA recognition motif-containing protein
MSRPESPLNRRRKTTTKRSRSEGQRPRDATQKTHTLNSDFDDESDTDSLAVAAAQWAAEKEATSEQQPSLSARGQRVMSVPTFVAKKEDVLSLHITQLAFDATDYDIRKHFSEQGCSISSLRMVFDKGQGGTRLFRGVAFIDVYDKASYDSALTLHKSRLLGRKINVRPTKSKEVLSSIVERTKDLVAKKIETQKAKEDELKKEQQEKVALLQKKRKREKVRTKPDEEEPERKLTRKERNRRAGIIKTRQGPRK